MRPSHSEPKGVNAPEDMQLSAYGQRLLVPGGTIPESLIEVTYALRGPKDAGCDGLIKAHVPMSHLVRTSLLDDWL